MPPRRLALWDAASGRRTQRIEAGSGNSRGAAALAFSLDGKSLAFAGQSLQVWNLLALAKPPLTLQQPNPRDPAAEQIFLAFSPDSRSLALLVCCKTSGHEQVLKSWDVSTGKEQFRWTRPYELSTLHAPIAWSPDGKQIAWGGPKPAVWNVASGKEIFPLAGHSSAVMDIKWSHDNRRVLTRCEVVGPFTRSFELKVWDAAKAQEIFMLRGQSSGWSAAPGFQALASQPGVGSDPGDVVVWDLAPGIDRQESEHETRPRPKLTARMTRAWASSGADGIHQRCPASNERQGLRNQGLASSAIYLGAIGVPTPVATSYPTPAEIEAPVWPEVTSWKSAE